MGFQSFEERAKKDPDYIRRRLEIHGGYDKHGDVFGIARQLPGPVLLPLKTFHDAKALEQFIDEFTFFRYGGRCPSWHSVLFASDCFSGEEKSSNTLKGKSYTPDRGKAYVTQLIASGELVVHCSGSWIPPGDRNHHLPWREPRAKEEVLPVVQRRPSLGPHEEPGYESPEKTNRVSGGGVVPDSSAKLSFDPSLNVVDKAFASRAGKVLADNPIGSAYYARLQHQGTDVSFVNDPEMRAMGEFDPNRNSVTINMLRHSSAEEAASTVVHEASHQSAFFKGVPQNTQFAEYQAFRNESFFQTGTRPSLQERLNIWNDIQELYPCLPQGRYPFGGGK